MSDGPQEIIVSIKKGDDRVTSSSGLDVMLSNTTINQQGASAGELLAMSLAACLSSTLKVVLAAHQRDVDYEIAVRHASHKELNRHDGFYFSYETHITLHHISQTLGEKYVALTKKLCPVSKVLMHHPHYQTFTHYK